MSGVYLVYISMVDTNSLLALYLLPAVIAQQGAGGKEYTHTA